MANQKAVRHADMQCTNYSPQVQCTVPSTILFPVQMYRKLWSALATPIHVSRMDAFVTVQQALGKAVCR